MRRSVCLAFVVPLSLAACGDDSTSIASRDEPPAGIAADDLGASCGSVEFPSIPADPSSFEPAEGLWSEIDLSEVGMEAEFFDRYSWSIAAQSDQALTLFGNPIDPTEPIEGYTEHGAASFERDADRWVPRSWGECRIELAAPGFGPARFVLDPNREPDPADTSVAILAHELACASGTSPGGRDVESIVVDEDDASVSIVVLVESPTGDQNCPSNPAIPLEVPLGSALGDRTVYDAGVQPALPRPWPPTELSLQTQGQSK